MSFDNKEKEFIVITRQINIPHSAYKIQLVLIHNRFVLRILKENELIDAITYPNMKPGVFGFPNLNDLTGWVLRAITIPHINRNQNKKSVQIISKQAAQKKNNKNKQEKVKKISEYKNQDAYKTKCKYCLKVLTPKSFIILMKKKRVYCPHCGKINHREDVLLEFKKFFDF